MRVILGVDEVLAELLLRILTGEKCQPIEVLPLEVFLIVDVLTPLALQGHVSVSLILILVAVMSLIHLEHFEGNIGHLTVCLVFEHHIESLKVLISHHILRLPILFHLEAILKDGTTEHLIDAIGDDEWHMGT